MFSPTSPMASPRRRVHAPRQRIPGVATAVAAGHGAVHPLLALAAWRWEVEGWNPAGIMLNHNRVTTPICKYTSIHFIKVFKLISEPLHESNRKLSRLFQASPGRRSQRGSAFRGLASREFWPGPPSHGVPSASWMVGAFAADIMRMF